MLSTLSDAIIIVVFIVSSHFFKGVRMMSKLHYKMYKAKKQFLYASIATAAIAGGLAFGSTNTTLTAHAATNNDTTNVKANSQTQVVPSSAENSAQSE